MVFLLGVFFIILAKTQGVNDGNMDYAMTRENLALNAA